ncbi:MAG: GNAT family N-acetyltransferase [Chthoniobacterales bacterium]
MIPTLTTRRIQLTPFAQDDARLVQRYAGDPEIARTTLNVPHPYPSGAAEEWIASHLPQYLDQRNVVFAIRSVTGEFYGAIGLDLDLENRVGELGYWIGRPFWGRGICTEAAQEVIDYAFESFPLNKVMARHLSGNVASGRAMEKAGMTREGTLRLHVIKNGIPCDMITYGILRTELAAKAEKSPSQDIQFRDTRDLPAAAVVALYSANGWSAAGNPELTDAVRASHSIVSAWDGDRLVGLATTLSDGRLVVYYPHLLVLPTYRRKGIGSKLMRILTSRYAGFHQQMIVADGGAVEFYQKCGFTRAGDTEPMWIYRGNEH